MGDDRPVADAGRTPGRRPPATRRGLGDAHRLQYLNFLGALDGTEPLRVDLETNRQVDRPHQRGVRVRADRAPGGAVMSGSRMTGSPPTRSRTG